MLLAPGRSVVPTSAEQPPVPGLSSPGPCRQLGLRPVRSTAVTPTSDNRRAGRAGASPADQREAQRSVESRRPRPALQKRRLPLARYRARQQHPLPPLTRSQVNRQPPRPPLCDSRAVSNLRALLFGSSPRPRCHHRQPPPGHHRQPPPPRPLPADVPFPLAIAPSPRYRLPSRAVRNTFRSGSG